MDMAYIWPVTIAIGAGTFGLRILFIQLFGKIKMPPLLKRSLRFIPPAVLSALVFPALFYPETTLDVSWGNEKLLAGIIAAIVAWRTGNVLLTVFLGMVILWLLKSFIEHGIF